MINEILKIPFVISDEDRQKYINDIEELFVKDNWCKEVPFYQTWPVLFNRDEKHWIDIKERVLSIIRLLDPEYKFLICWAYVSFVGKKSSLGDRWHTHFNKHNKNIGGLIYLQIENKNNGTMFDLGDKIIIPKVNINTLYIFNTNILHTPPYWDYENTTKNRIVLAMDIW